MPFSSSQTATNYQRVTWWILGFLGHISQYSRLLTLSQLQSGKPHLVIWDVMNIHEHSECVHGLSYSLRCKIGESNLESHQCIQGMTLPYVQACFFFFFFTLREISSWKIHEHLGRPTSKKSGDTSETSYFFPWITEASAQIWDTLRLIFEPTSGAHRGCKPFQRPCPPKSRLLSEVQGKKNIPTD